jgi:mono/diheme cytochrome c family protein
VWAEGFVVRALLRRFLSRAGNSAGGDSQTDPAPESGGAPPHYKTLRACCRRTLNSSFRRPTRPWLQLALLALVSLCGSATRAADAPVSFFREVRPILKQNCQGCHRPGKTKGGLDLTTFAGLAKGGKEDPGFVKGEPEKSRIIHEISGDEPTMPKDNEPLSASEVALIAKWIAQGAYDDTPPEGDTHRLAAAPIYTHLPAISSIAWSPDGQWLAVAGYHEVLLHKGDGSAIAARLAGESPRIEAVAFSPDGHLLGVAGGAPSEYGEIQLWDPSTQKLVRAIRTGNDAVYGLAFSPDGKQVSVGCPDKTVRAFSVSDGKEIMLCNNHVDWVFGTVFSRDGAQLASVSRDKSLKLIEVKTGRLVDDINSPRESLLSVARSPTEDLVVCGSENGEIRLFKMMGRGGRLSEGDNKENSFVRDFPRMPGPVGTLAFSPDGALLAAGSTTGDARIYKVTDGKQTALKNTAGPIYAIAFHPEGKLVGAAGFDGKVHLFDAKAGEQVREFNGVPLSDAQAQR